MQEQERAKIKIGDFLLKIGALTTEQVNVILQEQKQNPGKLFGVVALELGLINYSAITKYVKTILHPK